MSGYRREVSNSSSAMRTPPGLEESVLRGWMEAISNGDAEKVESASNEMSSIPNCASLSPILISYLSSGSRRLREASAVALGHIALSPGGARVLHKQGIMVILLRQAKKDFEEEEKGATLYALYHVLKEAHQQPSSRILLELVSFCRENLSLRSPVELYWLAYALSTHVSVAEELSLLIPSVFEVLLYEIFQKSDPRPLVKIVTPLLRLLGNLVASGEGPCLSVLQQPDLPAVLTTLLSTNYLHLVRETLWFFGNLVNNDSVMIQEELVELDLIDNMEYHLLQAVRKIMPFGATDLPHF